MKEITYADREHICDLRNRYSVEMDNCSDTQLARKVSTRVEELVRSGRKTTPIASRALTLSFALLTMDNHDACATARAALIYLLHENDYFPDQGPDGFVDDLYILSLALHELVTQGNLLPCISPEGLASLIHQDIVKELDRLRGAPSQNEDQILIAHASTVIKQLQPFGEAGLLHRFLCDIALLCRVLQSEDLVASSWARGGLRYLQLEQDLIPDDLGLTGLVDDQFAVALAAENATESSTSIRTTIRLAMEQFPYISQMVISDDFQREVSEFHLLTAAACRSAWSSSETRLTCLNGPYGNATPSILALMIGLQFLADTTNTSTWLPEVNQGVVIDDDPKHIYRFEGTRLINGREYFTLGLHFCSNNRSDRRQNWPLTPENLARISPAPDKRKIRGGPMPKLSHESRLVIKASDRILHPRLPLQLNRITTPVVIVSNRADQKRVAQQISVLGTPLSEVLPWAGLTSSGFDWWARCWGDEYEPAVVVASCVEEAADFIDSIDRPAGVLLTPAGMRPGSLVPTVLLERNSVPITMLCGDSDSEIRNYLVTRCQFKCFRWEPDTLDELVWDRRNSHGVGPLASEQRIVINASQGEISVVKFDDESLNIAWAVLHELGQSLRSFDSEDEIPTHACLVADAWNIMMSLSRWIGPPRSLPERIRVKVSIICDLLENPPNEAFIPTDDLARMTVASEALSSFVAGLNSANLKYDALMGLDQQYTLVLLERSAPAAKELSEVLGDVRVIALGDEIPSDVEVVVVPGVLARSKMARLCRPACAPVVKIFAWHPEADRFEKTKCAWRSQNRKLRAVSITSVVNGHAKPHSCNNAEEPPEDSADTGIEETATYMERLRWSGCTKLAIEKICSTGSDYDSVSCELIHFVTEEYAWIPVSGRIQRLEFAGYEASDREEVSIAEIPPATVEEGDLLLFGSRPGANAIREFVDSTNSSAAALREVASLWQIALRKYAQSNHLNSFHLSKKLSDHGCSCSAETILRWLDDDTMIAPRAYSDMEIIGRLVHERKIQDDVGECRNAVSKLRGLHIKASRDLAREVAESITNRVALTETGSITLSHGIRLIRVAHKPGIVKMISRSDSGRLIGEQESHG